MSHVQLCSDQDFLNLVAPEEKVEYTRKKMLYLLGLEITNFCGGSCAYCFSSSDTTTDTKMLRQKVLELIDEGAALQVRELALTGGDALTHPHWEEFAAYGAEKGMRVAIGTSFLISRELARRVCQYDVSFLCSHIDTLDPEAYAQVHFDGHVSPCNTLRELSVGNVYEESLTSIFEKHRDFLLHHHQIKGKCGDCENNDVCFGCRANAFYYLGDIQASDPKCWLNPAAPEYCYGIQA